MTINPTHDHGGYLQMMKNARRKSYQKPSRQSLIEMIEVCFKVRTVNFAHQKFLDQDHQDQIARKPRDCPASKTIRSQFIRQALAASRSNEKIAYDIETKTKVAIDRYTNRFGGTVGEVFGAVERAWKWANDHGTPEMIRKANADYRVMAAWADKNKK